jgi:hypothetical protein
MIDRDESTESSDSRATQPNPPVHPHALLRDEELALPISARVASEAGERCVGAPTWFDRQRRSASGRF